MEKSNFFLLRRERFSVRKHLMNYPTTMRSWLRLPAAKRGTTLLVFLATRPSCIPCTLDIAHHSLWLRNDFASFKEETALSEKRSVK